MFSKILVYYCEYLFERGKCMSPCSVLGFCWLQGQGRTSFHGAFFLVGGSCFLCLFSSGVVSVWFACAVQGRINWLFDPSWSLVKVHWSPWGKGGAAASGVVRLHSLSSHDFDYLDSVCVYKYTLTVEHSDSVGQCVRLCLLFWEAFEMLHFRTWIYTVTLYDFSIIPLVHLVKQSHIYPL